jgi:hypothetical protein
MVMGRREGCEIPPAVPVAENAGASLSVAAFRACASAQADV